MRKIEVLHPVTHNNVAYSRGVHEVPDDVADHFVKNLKCPKTNDRVAREFKQGGPVAVVGVTAPAPDSDEGRSMDSRVPLEGDSAEDAAKKSKGKKAKKGDDAGDAE
jgi:hypothetical protein